MTDTKCYICGHALEEHAPYVVWHTGWDGCEECDRDYERGVSLCPVCIDALGYMGMTVGGNTCRLGKSGIGHMTRFGMPSGCQMT